ncbi:uncharacterized protein K02A2.6-like [Pectinophora gossypiella]|uniref:uncharacterized protein K02A2.6-like n=1 Tax=Pectinophora gossypiella TaxID=13191 RepID=UPI00214F0053|nr:uncharacterized protein K02A2.6-like [Pectinophora gossypiella]
MRSQILDQLHDNHDGIVITKALARSYFWWPAIDRQIEEMIRECPICAEYRNMPPKVTHQWIRPEKAWSRLHIDYAGPFQGKVFLIVIDAFSKWPEVKIVSSMNSITLIKVLREIFVQQGIPDTIVSDNGRSFTSQEFKNFLAANNVKHVSVAPYHPASNGQAERTVQTIKTKLKKFSSEPWDIKLSKMLYGLRTTPNSVTGTSPAELLNKRKFKTKWDNLNPLSMKNNEQVKAIENNEKIQPRTFRIGQQVYVRNYCGNTRWLKGTVEKIIGACRYLVRWNGRLLMRHINQIQRGTNTTKDQKSERRVEAGTTSDAVPRRSGIILPHPSQWAEMIGVSGPQDIVLNEELVTSNRNKRIRSPSTSSPPSKRISLEDSDDNDEPQDIEEGSDQQP